MTLGQSRDDCICGGTGLVTRLTEGGGTTGPEVCTRCHVPKERLLSPDFAERVLTFHLASREAGMADSYRDAIRRALDA